MPSLRILQIAPYYEHAWAYGGIPRIVTTVSRALAQLGHEVTVCTTDACDAERRLSPAYAGATEADGITVFRFRNLSNRLAYHAQLFLPLGLRGFLRQQGGSFDVAHIHAHRNLLEVVAVHELRRLGIPYVLAPNGTAPVIEGRFAAKRLFDFGLGSRILSRAPCLLAVTHAERAQLLALGVKPERIRVLPNPIELAEFAATPRPPLASSPYVLFLGRLSPRKGVETLVRAMRMINDQQVGLVVAGCDMGSGRQARLLARRLGLGARVHFAGLLTGAERLAALAGAQVVVYAGRQEIFGLVALEALMSGTPVIVANDSGCAEIVRLTGGGLAVDPDVAEALAAALDRVLERRASWDAAASEAQRVIRAHFAPAVIARGLVDIYRTLAATKGTHFACG